MRALIVIGTCAALVSCAQDEPYNKGAAGGDESNVARTPAPAPPTPVAQPKPPATAEPSAAVTTPATESPPAKAPLAPVKAKPAKAGPPPALEVTAVTATFVSEQRGEDGNGAVVAAQADGAVAIDIVFATLPGRALDPVLEIGGKRFRRYQVRPGGILRYVIADRQLAEAGEAVLRWGQDVLRLSSKLTVER